MKTSKKQLILIAGLYVSIPIFLMTTDPERLPLPLLMAPFVLLFAALYMTSQIFFQRFLSNLGHRAQRGFGLALALLPVLLLILQSIGQLTARDLLIATGLIVLLVFYFRKSDFLA